MSLEQVGGDLARLVFDLSASNCTRSGGNRSASARIRSQSVWRRISVAFFDQDIINREAKFFGNDLRVRCFVPLTLRLRAEARDDFAGRMDANLGAVEHLDTENVEVLRRTGADDFGETADADSHQLTARAFFSLLFSQFWIADLVHCQLQCARRSCRCRTPSRARTCTETAPA